VAVGALEPQFFAALLAGLGLDPGAVGPQHDREGWPAMRAAFEQAFAAKPRDEWVTHFAGRDACVAPVLTANETPDDPHLAARGTVVDLDGVPQPAPAPRFSGTPAALDRPPPSAGEHTDELLAELGYGPAEIAGMREGGSVA
jgi:alpha-methylacyl-CoA racemase